MNFIHRLLLREPTARMASSFNSSQLILLSRCADFPAHAASLRPDLFRRETASTFPAAFGKNVRFYGNFSECHLGQYISGQNASHKIHSLFDRRTDGQNYDSQDRARIAASRGKNHFFYSA